jgi:hypothetical protein
MGRFERLSVLARNFSRSRSAGVRNPATRRGLARPTSQNQVSWPLNPALRFFHRRIKKLRPTHAGLIWSNVAFRA